MKEFGRHIYKKVCICYLEIIPHQLTEGKILVFGTNSCVKLVIYCDTSNLRKVL